MTTISLKDDFSNLEEFEKSMGKKLAVLWEDFQNQSANGLSYSELENWVKTFEPHGLSFDYYLTAEPYAFKLKTQL